MRPEDRLQSRCRMILQSHPPAKGFWSSVGHERKQTQAQGAMQQARGIKRGLPDMMFWTHGYFLGVELKATTKQTDAQYAFQAEMAALGHGYEVVRSVEGLGDALERHGIPLAPGWRTKAQLHDMALDAAPKPTRKAPAKPRPTKPTRAQITRGNRIALAMVRGGT
jgi:hypothetical protein